MIRSPFDIVSHHRTVTGVDKISHPDSEADQPRILLVDDEPRALASLHELLRNAGYAATIAATGGEALAYLSTATFDLVLLDLHLPDIDGHAVMDYLNAEDSDVGVVVISGLVNIEAAIGAMQRGAHDYLRKPYSREQLINTVGNALRRRRLEQTNRRVARTLENSERMYRYLIDASPDMIYMLNRDGCFTFVNDRARHLLGYREEELIGQHYSVVVHEDDRERACFAFNERRADARASRNVALRLISRADGTPVGVGSATIAISLNATGMHVHRRQKERAEFVGTYGIARDVTGHRMAEEAIVHQAYHDALTDLPNRTLFKDRLGLALIQAKRKRGELAVMFIDLDRFKLINDTLGHVKGDELLQQVAGRLKACLRKGDTLARQGGDEFTVVLPDLRSRDDARTVADKFLQRLHAPFDLGGHEAYISASVGIAVAPGDGESVDDLLRHADIAMYHVKAQGKRGHAFFDPAMRDETHQKVALEKSLRKALERAELELYYQPQVDAASGRIVGAEALIRWNHPMRGVVGPDEFLPLAEENGLMLPITEWMLAALCRDVAQWNGAGYGELKVSMNMSPRYLDRSDFVDKLHGALLDHGVVPARIEVEVTENICLGNPERVVEQLGKLERLGVSVAIDDFGTGFSSMAYLHRYPVHTIKIDRSFVKEIRDEHGHYPVVLAIISISRGLNLKLIAEGVETDAQARYLRANGCDTMQGYLFHRPLPQSDFIELLRAERRRGAEARD